MVIWSGWGVLVVVILFASLSIVALIIDGIFGAGTYENSYLYAALGTLLAAGLTQLFRTHFKSLELI